MPYRTDVGLVRSAKPFAALVPFHLVAADLPLHSLRPGSLVDVEVPVLVEIALDYDQRYASPFLYQRLPKYMPERLPNRPPSPSRQKRIHVASPCQIKFCER
jgi:hypothetical protein